MISIYWIITILATTVLAKGSSECMFSESAGIHQCFEAVGQPLIFHLLNKPTTSVTLIKDNRYRILNTQDSGEVIINEEYVTASEGIIDGIFKLGNAMKKHTGNYTLEEYNSNGVLLRKSQVNLEIQAPVSKPAVSQMCLTSEQMQIICSSEGDEAEFSLTLDGRILMQSKTPNQSAKNWTEEKDNSAVAINLHGQLTGNIMCKVWNKVSEEQTVIHLKACTGFTQNVPVVIVTASVFTFFLLVALALLIRKCKKIPRPTAANTGDAEDEVIYTDVRVRKNEQL